MEKKLGEAIKINEPDENTIIRNSGLYGSAQGYNVVARGASQARLSNEGFFDETGIDFKKIKLRFEVDVVFALK